MPDTLPAPVSPDRLMALAHGFWVSQVLATAAHYKFFSAMARGHRTASTVAAACGTDPHGTRMLLDSLVATEVLRKRAGEYELSPEADAFLVEGRPGDLSPMIADHPQILWENWGRLREAVKTGPAKPAEYTDDPEAVRFFAHLIRIIMPLALAPADALAAHLGVGTTRTGLRILDVGAGSGAWTIPFARRDPATLVTAFDLPHVVTETAAIVAEQGVSAQYRTEAGDLTSADFGTGRYDLAVLGNICHGLTPDQNRDLFTRLRRALSPGGQIAIADMIPNEERTGPPFPVLFAVNMFLMTGGDTYPFSEYASWLRAAGFSNPTTYDTGRSHSPIVLAGC
jgi:2-polyprenyl-3-methyl-5-hydroxy-6-metoxy-1,4-benzoquinol methylase